MARVLVAGGNTVTFGNSNTYSGGTTIQNRSTLVANNPAALPTGALSPFKTPRCFR